MATLPSPFLKWQFCLHLLTSVQLVWPHCYSGQFQRIPQNRDLCSSFPLRSQKDTGFFFVLWTLSLFQLMTSPPPPVATKNIPRPHVGSLDWRDGARVRTHVWRQLTNNIPCCYGHHPPLQSHDQSVWPHPVSLHIRLPGRLKDGCGSDCLIVWGPSLPELFRPSQDYSKHFNCINL